MRSELNISEPELLRLISNELGITVSKVRRYRNISLYDASERFLSPEDRERIELEGGHFNEIQEAFETTSEGRRWYVCNHWPYCL